MADFAGEPCFSAILREYEYPPKLPSYRIELSDAENVAYHNKDCAGFEVRIDGRRSRTHRDEALNRIRIRAPPVSSLDIDRLCPGSRSL